MKLFWVLAFFLLSPTAWSQSLVSTGQLHPLTPSVRANGMGGIGILSTDPSAAFCNPGALGLTRCMYGSISVYPMSAKIRGDSLSAYSTTTLTLPLLPGPLRIESRFSVVVSLQHVGYKTGPLLCREPSYVPPNTLQNHSLGVRSWAGNSKQIAVGLGYSNRFDLGLGVAIKYFTYSHALGSAGQWEWTREPLVLIAGDSTATALDVGFLVRIPVYGRWDSEKTNYHILRARLSLGAVAANLGLRRPRWPYWVFSSDTGLEDIVNEPPSLRSGRLGAATEIAYGRGSVPLAILKPAFELEAFSECQSDRIFRMGGEVGLLQVLWLRVGDADLIGSESGLETVGFTISTKGLKHILFGERLDNSSGRKGIGAYLLHNLDIDFSFAQVGSPLRAGRVTNYYSIDITL